jgi:hypothetical protein
MDDAAALIEKIREHYLWQFNVFVAEQRRRHGSGSAEVKFELSPQSSVFRRLYCVDFATKKGDVAIIRELQPDLILTFEPFQIDVRGVSIELEQLVWDDVEIHHDASNVLRGDVERWFNYWFDPEESRYDPGTDVSRIIHSLIVTGGQISIDLGTATTDAFWDMLDLVAAAGATTIRVTSSREQSSEQLP